MGLDKYAYGSKLAGVKTGNKIAFASALLIICMTFSSNLISVLTILIMSAATVLWGGLRPGMYVKLLLIPAAFLVTGIMTVIINQFGLHDEPLFAIKVFGNFYGVSISSLCNGVTIFLKSLGAITCLYFFSLNTPMNSVLSLVRKRFPGIIVELMELIYRFIFVIWEEAIKIHIAQASRLGYKGFRNSIESFAELVTTVFIRAFRRVERVNISLESRGFEGNFEFLSEEEISSGPMKATTITSCILLLAAGITERLMK